MPSLAVIHQFIKSLLNSRGYAIADLPLFKHTIATDWHQFLSFVLSELPMEIEAPRQVSQAIAKALKDRDFRSQLSFPFFELGDMTTTPLVSIEQTEIQRLKTLLPDALKSQIAIVRTTEVKPALIRSEKVGQNRCAIQIDLVRWEQLGIDHRNLLFWYEVARVKNRTVAQFPWEAVILGAGLGASLLELVSQNIVLFPIALTIAGLSGYQLYQRNRGENSLKEATVADRGAISLATQFGYPLSQAYSSLASGLRVLMAETSKKSQKFRYKVRLQVLDMSLEPNQPRLQLLEIPGSARPALVSPTRRQQKLAASKLI